MEPTESPTPVTHADPARKVLYVVGAGRSGTSTLAGVMTLLGLHVPQPEVLADQSNPKGFGEPRWVVDVHDRWLNECQVQVSDARPRAWELTARIGHRERAIRRTVEWLEPHFEGHPELLVKDPRLTWFLPLWRAAAAGTGATPLFATMLRPPAEVIGSRQQYYANTLGPAHLAASWLNVLLHTEAATRAEAGTSRVFVRYADLLADGRATARAVGDALDLRTVREAKESRLALIEDFIDPQLHRITLTLADLDLPPRLRELTEETWAVLDRLSDPAEDVAARHHELDELRSAYVTLYSESEAIARSTAVAARAVAEGRAARAAERRRRAPEPGTEAAAGRPAVPASAPVERASRADLVPHAVRARVPARWRQRVRRLLGRERS